jgi:hypothetical protein
LIQISDTNATGEAVSHFRNVQVLNRNGKKQSLVNLGGGPRPEPKSAKCVPVYIHDWYGPGKTAKIVSTKAKELTADKLDYRADPPLTGDMSRVAVVDNVPFPKMPEPVDDTPPATVITHVVQQGSTLIVRGTTSDNGTVVSVKVAGKQAKALRPNFAEWEAVLADVAPGHLKLVAYAEDAAGNIEQLPHRMTVEVRKG